MTQMYIIAKCEYSHWHGGQFEIKTDFLKLFVIELFCSSQHNPMALTGLTDKTEPW